MKSQPRCKDCGTPISRKAARCRHCAGVKSTPTKKKCLDCDKPIERQCTRCWPCYSVIRRQESKKANRCKDCNKVISRTSIRCMTCSGRYRATYQGTFCVDCRKPISKHSMRCRSCHVKKQWRDGILSSPEVRRKVSDGLKKARLRGAYDGVFQSPTNLELEVAAALDLLGLGHISQYRPAACKFSYDEYVPELNVLVEADGEYWHSLPKSQKRDKEKDKWAADNGYRLLRLPESDIIEGGAWIALAREIGDGETA